jgi:hypothetical protein
VPAARPEGFAFTVNVEGVDPEPGLTLNQAPPEAVAAMLSADPLLAIVTVCMPDVVDPAA